MSVSLRWYGERGVVNAILVHIQRQGDSVAAVRRLLPAVRWSNGPPPEWINSVASASLYVEWGWADFGNPDLACVCGAEDGARCVLIEKGGAVHREHAVEPRERNANAWIQQQHQLTLRYRFAKAVERTTSEGQMIEESTVLFEQYKAQLNDSRSVSPERWFFGPLEAVSVQGVRFVGVHVPADNPDANEAASLAGPLGCSA